MAKQPSSTTLPRARPIGLCLSHLEILRHAANNRMQLQGAGLLQNTGLLCLIQRVFYVLHPILPLQQVPALLRMAKAAEAIALRLCLTCLCMKSHSSYTTPLTTVPHQSIPPPQHFFQMRGSDHSKYAEAMKQQKIKGLSLASATDDELNDIFRSPMQHQPLQPKLAPHALLHCILSLPVSGAWAFLWRTR